MMFWEVIYNIPQHFVSDINIPQRFEKRDQICPKFSSSCQKLYMSTHFQFPDKFILKMCVHKMLNNIPKFLFLKNIITFSAELECGQQIWQGRFLSYMFDYIKKIHGSNYDSNVHILTFTFFLRRAGLNSKICLVRSDRPQLFF